MRGRIVPGTSKLKDKVVQCLQNKVETDYHSLGVVMHTGDPKALELKSSLEDKIRSSSAM